MNIAQDFARGERQDIQNLSKEDGKGWEEGATEEGGNEAQCNDPPLRCILGNDATEGHLHDSIGHRALKKMLKWPVANVLLLSQSTQFCNADIVRSFSSRVCRTSNPLHCIQAYLRNILIPLLLLLKQLLLVHSLSRGLLFHTHLPARLLEETSLPL